MSIERIYYCDRRECNTHGPGDEFNTVLEMRAGPERHFCSWGCLRKFIEMTFGTDADPERISFAA